MIKERTYYWKDREGKTQSTTLKYKLLFNNNQLVGILNQNNWLIEKDSECYDYFQKQF